MKLVRLWRYWHNLKAKNVFPMKLSQIQGYVWYSFSTGGDIRDVQNFKPVEVTWWIVSVLALGVTSSIYSPALNCYWLELSSLLHIWNRSSSSLTKGPYSNSFKVTLSFMYNFLLKILHIYSGLKRNIHF